MADRYPRVLEFVDRITGEKTVDDAWKAFLGFISGYGFHAGALSDLPGPADRIADMVVCVSWPDAWQTRYVEQDYVRRDPAVFYMSQSVLPYTWEDVLESTEFDKSARNIVHEAGDFGLHAGFVVPLYGLRSGNAVLTIAGENTETSRAERAEMHLAAIYAHGHIRGLVRSTLGRDCVNLTLRERECLRWAAAGKTDWEISEILSISEKTANAHIEKAKRKFNVATRVQAVMHAIRLGFIQP